MGKIEKLKTPMHSNCMCELVETKDSCSFRVKQGSCFDDMTLEEFLEKVNLFIKDKGIQLKIVVT